MSQNVERLKQLLFDSETTALQALAERLDSISEFQSKSGDEFGRRLDTLSISERDARASLANRIDGIDDFNARSQDENARLRAELSLRLDEVYAHAGDTEKLTHSVSQIISDVLRRAEVERHDELSQSLAPLLISTIKAELRNSQDEMVEALYPITGRLVKSYVASAIQDLTAQMNRRLEQNAVMLRLQSLFTGRSVAELALASAGEFAVKELYLIRRGSGALVAYWPQSEGGGREHAVSGVLAAVNEFANEAFSPSEQSLRHIDLGNEVVYLRGSPTYLLAARCSGQAPDKIARSLDDAMVSAVEQQLELDNRATFSDDTQVISAAKLADLGRSLTDQIDVEVAQQRKAGAASTLKFAAALLLLPTLGWFAWQWYEAYRVNAARSVAESVVAADPAMRGYPIGVAVSGLGKTLTISGLTPSQTAKVRIVTDLQRRLPDARITDQMSVVAGSDIVVPDVSPEIARVRARITETGEELARAGLVRTAHRATARLNQAIDDLKAAAAAQPNGIKLPDLESSTRRIERVRDGLGAMDVTRAPAQQQIEFRGLATQLDVAAAELLTAMGGPHKDAAATRPVDEALHEFSSERFAAAAERVAALSASLTAAQLLRPAPAVVAAPPPQVIAYQPTAREKLDVWLRSHAVFFDTELEYRNPDSVRSALQELAALITDAQRVVRVIGYTDETGGAVRNTSLAQNRAGKVRDDLIALGVAPNLLLTVGRASVLDLSDVRGAGTPNRRVQFEAAFEGEAQP